MTTDDRLTEQARGLRVDLVNLDTAVAGLAASVDLLAERTDQSGRTVTRLRRITTVIVVKLLITVGLICYLVILNHQLDTFSRCQAAYNTANNARTRALTEVTAKEREAERRRSDALDAAFSDPSLLKAERTAEDRARVVELFTEYLDAVRDLRGERAKADAARAANPVPPPPDTVC